MASEDDDFDIDDERTTSTTRRQSGHTDRLPSREVPHGEPVREDWLSSRTSARSATNGKRRRNNTVPSSRQEFALWLQYGGWRTVAIVVGATFAAIVLMVLVANRANAPRPFPSAQPTFEAGFGGSDPATLPTLDPLAEPTITPAPQPPVAVEFRVFGTTGQGLFLRADHSTGAAVLDTLPDGTIVTIIGEDYPDADRVWKNIRSPGGQEGWAASDFLEAAQ